MYNIPTTAPVTQPENQQVIAPVKVKGKPGPKPGSKQKVKGKDSNESATKPANQPTTKPVTDKIGRGVVLIALGSAEYGKMAANAAASIRFSDKKVPIHLVHSGNSLSHLTDAHRRLFTSIAECPAEYHTTNGKPDYIKAKTHIYDLSPYYETLLLDVDLLWFGTKNMSDFITMLAGTDFAMQSRGVHNYATGKTDGKYTHWVDVKQAQQAYGLTGNFYQLSSEVMWFRKTKEVKAFFTKAKQIYSKPKVATTVGFGTGLPDEFAFNIAANLCGLAPRKAHDVFIYWQYLDKTPGPWNEIIARYHGYSMGGNNIPTAVRQRYEQMARHQAQALRLPYYFKVYPKKQWDNTRRVL